MASYRSSHLGLDRGRRYDLEHAGKMDSVIWDQFVKSFVCGHMQLCFDHGGRRYLDFACGTGRVLKLGRAIFEDATGIDVSADMLEVARDRVPDAEFHRVDVTVDPEAVAGPFDCATLFRFLLNAERELSRAVLEWLAGRMRSGAILIVNNHMTTGSFRGFATLASNAVLKSGHNHLSSREIRELLSEAGFTVIEQQGFRVLPTIGGKAIVGKQLQVALERVAVKGGLGALGAEQIFVAVRQ